MLGDLDRQVQHYVNAARENGAAVGTRVVMAAAEGIVTKFARLKLATGATSTLLRQEQDHY